MSNVESKPKEPTASAPEGTERPNAAEEVKAGWPLAMSLGVAGLLLLFVLVVGIMYYFTRSFEPRKEQPNEATPSQKLSELLHSNDEELNGYGWVDQKKQIVRLPIERAMELVVDEAGRTDAKSASKSGSKSDSTTKEQGKK